MASISYDDTFLQGKTDAQLSQIATSNTKKAMGTNDVPTLERLVAETKACGAILSARNETRKAWDEDLPERQHNAILNLKNAVTPNGQLIAAILEDEGDMTAEQICCWCEELEGLGLDNVKSLLDALVSEGVLKETDGSYRLYRICTGDLFPENPIDWAMKLLEANGKRYNHYKKYVLSYILSKYKTKATFPTDILEELRDDFQPRYIIDSVPEEERLQVAQAINEMAHGIASEELFAVRNIENLLEDFIKAGILRKTGDAYRFTLLGEG